MAELADAPDLGFWYPQGYEGSSPSFRTRLAVRLLAARPPPGPGPSPEPEATHETEFTDVTETRKTLTVEIPSDIVDAEIARITKGYTKQAKIPGFRPGKVPASVVKQRFKDQILQDVMQGLIPRAIEEALQERGIEPVDTPDVKDVALGEGQALRFTAAIETVPSFDPGDLSTVSLKKHAVSIDDEAVNGALDRLRERAARFEPVEARAVADGDTVVVTWTARVQARKPITTTT